MLQRDRYWDDVLVAIGREDLRVDPAVQHAGGLRRSQRRSHLRAGGHVRGMFLDQARTALGSQSGQWDVMQNVLELPTDPEPS